MRKRRRNRKQVRVVIGLSICLLLIMTVGYAAFSTNLTISAKGNIKDYNAAWQLKKKVVNNGDGLYKDSYEVGRYVYKGQKPDNYLNFNNELWRIVAIEADDTLKIISNKTIGGIPWDNDTNRNNENNTYCNREFRLDNILKYGGCNVWGAVPGIYNDGTNSGVVNTNASLNNYLNGDYYNSLNEDKNYIESHNFNIGSVGFEGFTTSDMYTKEKTRVWKGLIGLLNTSDFLKSSINQACNSYDTSRSEQVPCTFENGNYLDELKVETWTINAYSEFANNPAYTVIGVHTFGAYFGDIKAAISGYRSVNPYQVRPVLFLKADIKLSGSGTENDPYIIKE